MITTKAEWLTARDRILTGQMTGEDLPGLYKMFNENCIAMYKATDMTTFQDAFVKWFSNPVYINSKGFTQVTSRDGIVGRFMSYMDAKFHVTYLFDKTGKIIKAY